MTHAASQPTDHADDCFGPDAAPTSAPRSLWVQGTAGVEFFRRGPATTCGITEGGAVCGGTIETGFICERHVVLLVPRMPRAQVLAEAAARYHAFKRSAS